MNIKFSYQYRDGANYKNHHEVIFSNKIELPIEEIKTRILNRLISTEFFYADQFGLPDLHFDKWDNEIDHLWHEFIDVEETNEMNTYGDVSDFLIMIEKKIKFQPQY